VIQVGNMGSIFNCYSVRLHYDEIWITLGGLHMGRNFKVSFWAGYKRRNATWDLAIDSAICFKQEENHRESLSNRPSRRAFKKR
jgi:hypothetical protein